MTEALPRVVPVFERAGRLRRLLPEYASLPLTLCAIFPRHRHLSARLRHFVELLVEGIGDRPYWDPAN